MIGKILAPLDGSGAAEAALPYLERIAAATEADVLLMAAVHSPRDWITSAGPDVEKERLEDLCRR